MSLQDRIEAEGVPFLTRAEWGADVDRWRWNSGSRTTPIAMRLPVDEFYVHHSVTLADDDHVLEATGDVAADMREIERIGLARFGRFSYSFGLHPSGVIAEGCGNWIGAHTYGRNSTSLAGVAIGNYEADQPPKALIRSYGILLRALRDEGWTTRTPTIAGHRDVRATGCPGGFLYAALPDIRHLASLDTAQARPEPTPTPSGDPQMIDVYQLVRDTYAEAGASPKDVAEDVAEWVGHIEYGINPDKGRKTQRKQFVTKLNDLRSALGLDLVRVPKD